MVPDKAVYRNNLGAACFALADMRRPLESFSGPVPCIPYAPMPGRIWASRKRHRVRHQRQRPVFAAHFGFSPGTATPQRVGEPARPAWPIFGSAEAFARRDCSGAMREFHAALGNLLLNAGLPDQAAEQYRAVIALNPGDAMANFNLGNACEELHDTDEARQCFAQAAELRPEKRLLRLRADICGPVVFETGQEIEEYCEKVESVLEEWKAETPSPPAPLPSTGEGSKASSPPAPLPGHHVPMVGARGASLNDILEAGVFPSFDLAYHGREQRRLKEQFAGTSTSRTSATDRRRPAAIIGIDRGSESSSPAARGHVPKIDAGDHRTT